MIEKKYYKILELDKIAKQSKNICRYILYMLLVLFIINVVSGYKITKEMGYKRKLASIMLIESNGAVGTGFLITDNYVLTAAHVAKEVGSVVHMTNNEDVSMTGDVVASGYSQWKSYITDAGQVKAGATEHDWALIRLRKAVDDIEPMIPGGKYDANQGDEVYLVGHPAGQDLTITKGIISRIGENEIFTDSEIDPGFSGGPMILAERGEEIEEGLVVGIMVSSPKGFTTLKTAIPTDIALIKCQEAGYSLW